MKLVFAGTPNFAVPSLQALATAGHELVAALTQPDRPAGRGREIQSSAVAKAASALHLPIAKPGRLDSSVLAWLRRLAPDVIVVVAYGLLLPDALLDMPRLGCLNVHASLLPRWRGAAPIARAIEAGDIETGVCIMRIDAGLDTGPVLDRVQWPIPPNATATDANDALASLGAHLLVDALSAYSAGRITPQPQTEIGVCYAHKLTKAEARMDWTLSAMELSRKIRAFNPVPVAWTELMPSAELAGERIRIWQAQATPDVTTAAPGTIVRVEKDGIGVATGHGVLRLTILQRTGGRAHSAAELLSGWNLHGRHFS